MKSKLIGKITKIISIIFLIICYFFIDTINKYNIFIKRPKISILMPVFNKEKYLNRSIGCILNQTFKDIEIVIVNDYSTDNSLNMLQNFSKNDSRMKIINHDKNRGLFYSRASCILNSTGEYLMFLEPDDFLKGENNLEYLYNEIKETKEDLISFGYYHVNQKQKKFKCKIFNKTIFHPKIFDLAFDSFHQMYDLYIWNKLLKEKF